MDDTPMIMKGMTEVKAELKRMENQCDERHTNYSARIARNERRLQQLFGDDDTQTPGMLAALKAGQDENKAIALSTKKEVQGIKLKLGALLAALQVVGWVLMYWKG